MHWRFDYNYNFNAGQGFSTGKVWYHSRAAWAFSGLSMIEKSSTIKIRRDCFVITCRKRQEHSVACLRWFFSDLLAQCAIYAQWNLSSLLVLVNGSLVIYAEGIIVYNRIMKTPLIMTVKIITTTLRTKHTARPCNAEAWTSRHDTTFEF